MFIKLESLILLYTRHIPGCDIHGPNVLPNDLSACVANNLATPRPKLKSHTHTLIVDIVSNCYIIIYLHHKRKDYYYYFTSNKCFRNISTYISQ